MKRKLKQFPQKADVQKIRYSNCPLPQGRQRLVGVHSVRTEGKLGHLCPSCRKVELPEGRAS